MLRNTDFSRYFHSPEELATQVLQVFFRGKDIAYPIDPFKILQEFGIVFQLRNFDKLEGVYIVPEDESDIPIVGINSNRPITRQRFTAAHEICHHIKDKTNVYCPMSGQKNKVEKFADDFAANLLMPLSDLEEISNCYIENEYIDFDNVLRIADFFGVSFESCVFRLAYKMRRISGETDSESLRKRIRSYKPQKKRVSIGLENHDIALLRNIINSYEFFFPQESNIVRYKFKNDFVFNENRLEGLSVDHDEVSMITTDLRMKKQESLYCNSANRTIIEVCGHSTIYDYILSTEDKISVFSLLRLHKLLYQYSPHPEAAGVLRQTNVLVINSKFETSDYHDIITQMAALDKEVQGLLQSINQMTVTDYIDRVMVIHHRITLIHPFQDGNGRVSRAFVNWLFTLKGLPPVYLKQESKEIYLQALSIADRFHNYLPLNEIFYREILRSMCELNSKFMS